MAEATATLTVELRNIASQHYLGIKTRAPLAGVGPAVRAGFEALYHRLAETRNRPVGAPFLISQLPRDGYLEVEMGAPCAMAPEGGGEFHRGLLPGGKVAATVFRGPYADIGGLYPQLLEWINHHGLRPAGPPREVYLSPPGEEPVTELVWPVT